MNELEVIVQTLKYSNDVVAEIATDGTLTRVWVNDLLPGVAHFHQYQGKKISDLPHDSFFAHARQQVADGLSDKIKSAKEYSLTVGGLATNYLVKVLINHPDANYIFLTAEQITGTTHNNSLQSKWKQALEASGDGVWNCNFDDNSILFSEKWYNKFGYIPGEFTDLNYWISHIHPDDRAAAKHALGKYTNRETDFFTVKIRFPEKNGNYKWVLVRGVSISKNDEGKPIQMIGTHLDITEAKLIEEEHNANISMLLRLINNIPSGILVTDENKKLVLVNKSFCSMYGIEKHPKDLLGINTQESLQQDKLLYKDQEGLVTRIQNILEKKQTILNDELEMLDGRIISRDYVPLSFKENYKGEIWRFTDITQQKNVKKLFQEQREFFEHILNYLPAHVATLDADKKILYSNPNFIKDNELRVWSIGKTLEEYCNKILVPPAITEERLCFFDTAVRDKRKIEWDEKIVGRKGRVSYQLRCFYPIFKPGGELDIMIAYGVDITDRISAEEALKSSMAAFANSFNFSGIGKALIDLEGKWIEVNDVFCQIVGYTKEELIGMPTKDILFEEDVALDSHDIAKLIDKVIQSYTIEKRYVSKTRQIINASITVSLLRGNDDTPLYFICDIIDITDKKQLTDELYRQNAELEAAKSNLVNKINQLEELSYMIAHNLRGPANNIKMFAERLIIDDNSPEAEDEVFTKEEASIFINESSLKLTNSLNTLMELTQIKLNKNIAYDDCDFKSIINDIINQLHGVVYEKHAQINLHLGVAQISYPKVYLESILYNLISNALKYSNPQIPPEITITTQLLDGKICLSVKDNGLGIDLEVNGDKVFKLNKIFHKGYDSKGVGLFLTKSQIESLGGTIKVLSKPNEGSEFIAML